MWKLQRFTILCFENYWLGEDTYISKIWLVFLTLNWCFALFNSVISGQIGEGENAPIYSCKWLGLYTFLLGWL